MPMLDKPLEELRTYRGMNPRPADFDAYWTAALADLDRVDPAVVLEPAGFTAPGVECFDLWFTGTGGARIYAKYLRPAGAGPLSCPAVLQFHGYSQHSGPWVNLLPYAQSGLCIAALDCRGQGGRSQDVGGVRGNTLHGHIVRGLEEDDPQRLLFRHIFLDTVRLARVVAAREEVDATRLGACGGSQGGGLTLACAALVPELDRCAPVFPFLCDYRRVWDMDLDEKAYRELRDWFRLFDPTHARAEAVFTRLGYIDCQHLAPRIRARTLMATALRDDICPPSTQFAAYNRIEAEKEMVVYPDFGHEPLPGMADRTFRFMCEMLDARPAEG